MYVSVGFRRVEIECQTLLIVSEHSSYQGMSGMLVMSLKLPANTSAPLSEIRWFPFRCATMPVSYVTLFSAFC